MSRYIPQSSVIKESVAQAVRRAEGLKNGAYVRVKIGPKIGTTLRSKAEAQNWTIISEEEFQQRAAGKFEEPATDAGTVGTPNEG